MKKLLVLVVFSFLFFISCSLPNYSSPDIVASYYIRPFDSSRNSIDVYCELHNTSKNTLYDVNINILITSIIKDGNGIINKYIIKESTSSFINIDKYSTFTSKYTFTNENELFLNGSIESIEAGGNIIKSLIIDLDK